MELGLSTPARGSVVRRAAPIACGCALAAAAAVVATYDPAAAGSRYPSCVFHQMTGLWCPGCGLTRGTHQLLHGHVGDAISSNVFTPLALAAIGVVWFGWLRVSWGATPIHVPRRTARWLAVLLPSVVIAYGILRNLPIEPLRSLAP